MRILSLLVLLVGLVVPTASVIAGDVISPTAVNSSYQKLQATLTDGRYISLSELSSGIWAYDRMPAFENREVEARHQILNAYSMIATDEKRSRATRQRIEGKLKKALSLLHKHHGKDSFELASYYQDIGQLYLKLASLYPALPATMRKGQKLFSKASDLFIEQYENDNRQLAAAMLGIVNRIQHERYSGTRQYFSLAKKLVADLDVQTLQADVDYLSGMNAIKHENYERGERKLLEALATAKQEQAPDNLVRRIHAGLVIAAQKLGKEEMATNHSVAVARLNAANAEKGMQAIYTEVLDYSQALGQRTAWGGVTVEFTVDEEGFVKDPTFVAGPESLKTVALRTVKNFRYAPQVQGGELVATSGVRYKFEFVDVRFRADRSVSQSYTQQQQGSWD